MIVVFVVLAAVVVLVIALVAIGAVTGRLAAAPPKSVFQLDAAVVWVGDHVPDDVSAQLSYDDVKAMLGWYLDYLEIKGVAGETDDELEALPSGPIVAAEDEGVAYVLGRAEDVGLECDDVQVLEVVEAALAYLRMIGAIGAEVPPPPDPAQ